MQKFVYIRKNISNSAKQIEVASIWVFTRQIVHVIAILSATGWKRRHYFAARYVARLEEWHNYAECNICFCKDDLLG